MVGGRLSDFPLKQLRGEDTCMSTCRTLRATATTCRREAAEGHLYICPDSPLSSRPIRVLRKLIYYFDKEVMSSHEEQIHAKAGEAKGQAQVTAMHLPSLFLLLPPPPPSMRRS